MNKTMTKTKSSSLSSIQRGRQSAPPRIMIYGAEGAGKSTAAAGAPAPIFIQTEDGLGEIDCDRFPLATDYDTVLNSLQELRETPHEYQTVVIDSVDWLERLIWDKLCADSGNVASIEKVDGGYGKGYTAALSYWREILGQLDCLRNEKGMIAILIAHSKIERFEDPESPAYDRYSPRLHKHACALVTEWCDAVLFATKKIRVASEDAGFNRKRTTAQAIGRDGGDRILRTVGGPACLAKNRYGINEDISLSWAAFVNAVSENSKIGGEKS